jgi:HTH-type transcriptional regulator / antitoxin HigA
MEVRPVRSDTGDRATLHEVSALVEQGPTRESPEGERLDFLATLVESWERRHAPINLPDAVEAMRVRKPET